MNINKKSFIVIVVLAVFAIIALSVATWYISSYHTLTIDIKRENATVTVVRADNGQEIKTIEQSDSLRLADGDYMLHPASTDADRGLSDEPYSVTIDGDDQTIVVDPDLSAQYRQQILDQHSTAIRSAILKAEPIIKDFYKIVHMEILGRDGDWAAIVIDQQVPNGAMADTYFALVHQESGKWVVKTSPQIVLTSADYPDIPHKVLVDTNNLYSNIENYR